MEVLGRDAADPERAGDEGGEEQIAARGGEYGGAGDKTRSPRTSMLSTEASFLTRMGVVKILETVCCLTVSTVPLDKDVSTYVALDRGNGH